MLARPLSVVLALSAAALPCAAGAPEISVAFLGDRGHHRPAERAALLAPYLESRGIAMDYTEDPGILSADRLAPYDALVLYANLDSIEPGRESALLDYVASGRGFVPLHCASYCFRNSDAFVRLVGAQFARHGLGPIRARVVDPFHPAMAGLADVETIDETYEHVRVESDRSVLMARECAEGRLEPVTWTRTHGRGRVFYTALGHDERTWKNEAFLALVERGIRWASAAPPPFETIEAEVPTYAPGAPWGTAGKSLERMQAPLSPRDSMKHVRVAPGLDVALFAAEPDLGGKPIDLAWDDRGRLFLAETIDYPNEIGTGRDKIRICEDRDGDGRAETFTVFAEGLSIATSLAFARGGLVVAQAPDVLFLADTDGDDRADVREVLFTGFGVADTHAGPSHFRARPDGWVWATVGYSGFDGVVGGKRHRFGQGIFRFRPDGSEIEFLGSTSNNTWGLGFNEEGDAFASTANGEHSVFLAIPNRYYESVPGFFGRGVRRTPDHLAIHPITSGVRQVDYFGGFTAAAGHAIYTGRLFPREYWNRVAFVCEPTGHLVHSCALEPDGAGYVAREFGHDLFASADEWTAPVAAEVGPDGAVWILDWYNFIVQHNPTPAGHLTGRGNAYETPLRDKTRARIYRVFPAEKRYQAPFRAFPAPEIGRRGEIAELARDAGGTAAILDGGYLADANAHVRRDALLALSECPPAAGAGQAIHAVLSDPRAARDRILFDAAIIAAARHDAPFLAAALSAKGEIAGAVPAPPPRRLAPGDFRPTIHSGDARFDVAPPALVVTSDAGADASFGASVAVRPGATYALRGRIRTEGVRAGSGSGALLNVHELQGEGYRVRTTAVTGDSPWTPVEVEFDVADRTRITVNCLLGGWGRSTGRAYFDSIEIAEVKPPGPTGPVGEALRVVTAALARRADPDATGALLETLGRADPVSAGHILEGLAGGWPEGRSIPLGDAARDRLRARLGDWPEPTRGAFLALAARAGLAPGFEGEIRSIVSALLAAAADRGRPAPERVAAAARALRLSDEAPTRGAVLLSAALEPAGSPLAGDLVSALAECRSSDVARELIARFEDLPDAGRRAALDALLRREAWSGALLDAVERRAFAPAALSVEHWEALLHHASASIATRARRLRDLPPDDARRRAIEALAVAISEGPPGDAETGRRAFEKNCAACHAFGGAGGAVGPDLSGVSSRERREILLDVLDPNRSVEGNYRLRVVVTRDEEIFTGRLESESRTTLVLVDGSGRRHAIARDEIAEDVVSDRSVMPEGFEALPAEDLAGILAYLARPPIGGASSER